MHFCEREEVIGRVSHHPAVADDLRVEPRSHKPVSGEPGPRRRDGGDAFSAATSQCRALGAKRTGGMRSRTGNSIANMRKEKKMNRFGIYLAMAAATACTLDSVAEVPWRAKLENQLPLLGHRNWIVIADSAYPWQTAEGIETVYTDADQIEVIKAVLEALAKTRHVRPIVYIDAELRHVPEEHARGIAAYREELGKVLAKWDARSLPHDQIIAKLDEAGKTFHILVLKTRLTLPYTSVFLQLDCGYWNADAEEQLRETIEAAAEPRAKPRT